jgi:hypothetical protein
MMSSIGCWRSKLGCRRSRIGCRMSRVGAGRAEYTDKKENQIFLIYKEIQSGAVAKSYMTNGLLIYREIFTHILIY